MHGWEDADYETVNTKLLKTAGLQTDSTPLQMKKESTMILSERAERVPSEERRSSTDHLMGSDDEDRKLGKVQRKIASINIREGTTARGDGLAGERWLHDKYDFDAEEELKHRGRVL